MLIVQGGEVLRLKQTNTSKFKNGRFFILQGEEGTGKTYEAINRAAYLSTDYCLYSDDNILFITNDEKASIKDTYNNLKDNSSNLTFFSAINNSFEVLSVKELIHSYFNNYKNKTNKNYSFIEGMDERENVLLEAIAKVKEKYTKSKLLKKENAKFILEEIDYIRANYLDTVEEYQSFVRKGRGKKLPKNSSSREAIYEVLKTYKALLETHNWVDTLHEEMLALEAVRKVGSKKYTHIFIDNSETLSKLQLKMIRELLENKTYSNFILILNKVDNLLEHSYFNSHKSIKDIDNNKYKTIKFKEKLENREMCLSVGSDAEVSLKKAMTKEEIELKDYTSKVENFHSDMNEEEVSNESITLIVKQSAIETKGNDEKNKMRNLYMDYFNYKDIRHRMEYDFAVDSGSSREVILDPNGSGETLSEDELRAVPVYSDIAAGEPILISDEFEGNFSIPTYWLKGVKDAFMLKVKGDSMIGANIHDGDYVLIRQQTIANNNDIVAVDLDGNATLKRLSIKKDGIFLIPENPKYDPIKIESEDAMIMGTAIGVISRR